VAVLHLVTLVNFFLNSWLALVLAIWVFRQAKRLPITSLYYVGGIAGGLVMGAALDKAGPAVLGAYAILGAA